MPQMDPKIAAFLKANPDRTPHEATQILYGSRREDVALPPDTSIGGRLRGAFNRLYPATQVADKLARVK